LKSPEFPIPVEMESGETFNLIYFSMSELNRIPIRRENLPAEPYIYSYLLNVTISKMAKFKAVQKKQLIFDFVKMKLTPFLFFG